MKATIGITGANGFIGKNLVSFFNTQGYKVFSLQRSASDNANVIPYNLHESINEKALNHLDIIIHSAVQHYGPKNKDSDRINLKAAFELVNFAERNNKRIIFLSTLSAHPEAKSHYGSSKLMLEKLFIEKGHLVLKLGLVVGDNGGLFHSIRNTIKKTSIIPLLGKGNQPIQTIYIKDLEMIIKECIDKNRIGLFHLAHPECFQIKEMYRQIAANSGNALRFIQIPFPLLFYPVKIAEVLGLKLPVNSESVLGLKYLRCFETASDITKLETPVSSFKESLSKIAG